MANLLPHVGVLGATSLVGRVLMAEPMLAGYQVTAFSRQQSPQPSANVNWQRLHHNGQTVESIPHWVCVAPIWVLPEHFALLESCGARKVVALSSTSRFTKDQSTDLQEQQIAKRLADAEELIQSWAAQQGVQYVILRPTLIYGFGQDKNISEMARFIRQFSFFPLFGKAKGLRQPIHAEDVAAACVAALQTPDAANCSYNISGGETLTYRDMVTRIFTALGRRPRLITVPLWSFRLAVSVLRCLPRYRHWSTAMAERMNQDLVFDYSEAVRDFGFKPRGFVLASKDLQE